MIGEKILHKKVSLHWTFCLCPQEHLKYFHKNLQFLKKQYVFSFLVLFFICTLHLVVAGGSRMIYMYVDVFVDV